MRDLRNKIKPLAEVAALVADAKARGLRVAQLHGAFGAIHPGYIRDLVSLREAADLLVATVAPDTANNEASPCFHSQSERAESVAALLLVDYVALCETPSVAETILRIRPDVYARERATWDGWNANDCALEKAAVHAVGGQVHEFGTPSPNCRPSNASYVPSLSPEAWRFVERFRQQHTARELVAQLERLRELRVLVLGDIIIDEYHYCKAMGKASKSATLTARFLSAERHAGGVLAVANNIGGFAGTVHLVGFLGDPVEDEEFIRGNLRENVRATLIRQAGRPTVVKRRYVEPFQTSKMFEVCWLDSEEPSAEAEASLLSSLAELLPQADLVVVADFGHGSVGTRMIDFLAQQAQFLAVNAQTNSANMGFNLITKYPRADYICVDEEEMRLAHHSRYARLEDITAKTVHAMRCQVASVTLGTRGSLVYVPGHEPVYTPAFSGDVVDSVGAGDAYLSITSLCVRAGLAPELVGFVGNCMGALAVRIVGNREAVDPEHLKGFVQALLA